MMETPPLTIRIYGDPCLRKVCDPVAEVGPSERMLIQSMIVTLHEHKGIGLAAPQVGINQRILVTNIGEGPMVIVNPNIIKQEGNDILEEGCLSIPGVNIKIERANWVIVKYLDENNNEIEANFEDLMARVVLHEIDHLNGKMIVDYACDEEIKNFKDQLDILEQEFKGE